jgi:catechol 2,3-dioxygenase-like lactoylglutathione lyase family enzyme
MKISDLQGCLGNLLPVTSKQGAKPGAERAPAGRVLVRQLSLGGANLSIHREGNGVQLVAANPTPGAADLCLRWPHGIAHAVAHLVAQGIRPIEPPSPRVTADGHPALSVFFTDLDGNLIELMAAS